MTSETMILRAMHTSRIAVGSGKIRIARIPTSATGMRRPGTVLFPKRIVPVVAAITVYLLYSAFTVE
jgi:hypothetical protein